MKTFLIRMGIGVVSVAFLVGFLISLATIAVYHPVVLVIAIVLWLGYVMGGMFIEHLFNGYLLNNEGDIDIKEFYDSVKSWVLKWTRKENR